MERQIIKHQTQAGVGCPKCDVEMHFVGMELSLTLPPARKVQCLKCNRIGFKR